MREDLIGFKIYYKSTVSVLVSLGRYNKNTRDSVA